MKRISIVIPARNERESLPQVLAELPAGEVHEILVVDGHSTDGTPALVRELGHRVVVQDGRGYGLGVISGIRAATGELLTFMDADGSYDPGALPRMLELVDRGNDIVFCSRYLPEAGSDDDTVIRAVGNWLFTFLLRAMFGVRLTDALFFYALGRKELFEGLELEARDFAMCVEIPVKVHKAGYRYAEMPLKERARIAGDTKVNAFWDGLAILAFMVRLKLKGF